MAIGISCLRAVKKCNGAVGRGRAPGLALGMAGQGRAGQGRAYENCSR